MASQVKKSLAALCPNCDETVSFNKQPQLGQLVVCSECGDELEVVRLNPIVLDWPEMDEEEDDWEYSDDDDYEDYDDDYDD